MSRLAPAFERARGRTALIPFITARYPSLDAVGLIAPPAAAPRVPLLAARSGGFLYCLARTGVTGQSAGESRALPERLAALRLRTPLPIAVGFGISSPQQARALRGEADAV